MSKNQKGLPARQAGVAHLLLLIAAVGLIAFLLISNTFGFKDKLFNTLFPKPKSQAAGGGVVLPSSTIVTTVAVQLTAPWPIASSTASLNTSTNLSDNNHSTKLGKFLTKVFTPQALAQTISSQIIEAENMVYETTGGLFNNLSGAIQYFTDSSASNGKAIIYYSNDTARTTFSNTDSTNSLTVRVKGDQCRGTPNMEVRIDGSLIYSTSVSSTSWADYASNINVNPGTHSLTIKFTNDYIWIVGNNNVKCDRNLRVDKITLNNIVIPLPSPTPTPSPTPVVTPTPSSSPIISPSPTSSPPVGVNPFKGEYWNIGSFSVPVIPTTTPNLVRTDNAINFDWGTSSPDPKINADKFAIRWTGAQNFPVNGAYRFNAYTEDGVRLYVDEKLVIDHWLSFWSNQSSQPFNYSGNIYLSSGTHQVKVEYYNDYGQAKAQVSWSLIPASPPTTISATIAEDLSFTKNVLIYNGTNPINVVPYNTNPYKAYYTFSDPALGTKNLYVKFTFSDGSTQDYSASTQLVTQTFKSQPSISPNTLGVPIASPIPSGMNLVYDNVQGYAPYDCYHEDSFHSRYWQGTLNPGESMTIPMPECTFEKYASGPGADGILAYVFGNGNFSLTATSPSGKIYQAHQVGTDSSYQNLRRCLTQPEFHLINEIGYGTIEPGVWNIVVANTGSSVVTNVQVGAQAFQTTSGSQRDWFYCPQADWNLVYP